METTLVILLIVSTFIQLLFWFLIFRPLRFVKPLQKAPTNFWPAISVIICARNAVEELQKGLPFILSQEYKGIYEVCVINDASTDETAAFLNNLKSEYDHLRVLHLQTNKQNHPGKKYALSQGIAFASHELLLLTDADCRPLTNDWLTSMAKYSNQHVQIVLGFSPYAHHAGWLNRFIRYEAVMTAIQYMGFANKGMPYMGVGRNLMYTKSLYQQGGGFEQHTHIASGDDDLFINAVANASNTQINLVTESFVESLPKNSWNAYFQQRKRHVSTASEYQLSHKILLALLTISYFFHYICTISLLLLFQKDSLFIGLGCYILRLLFISKTFQSLTKTFQSPNLAGWLPVLELIQLLYFFLLFPFTFLKQKQIWT